MVCYRSVVWDNTEYGTTLTLFLLLSLAWFCVRTGIFVVDSFFGKSSSEQNKKSSILRYCNFVKIFGFVVTTKINGLFFCQINNLRMCIIIETIFITRNYPQIAAFCATAYNRAIHWRADDDFICPSHGHRLSSLVYVTMKLLSRNGH